MASDDEKTALQIVSGYILVEPSLYPSSKTCEWEASSNPLEGCVPSPLPGRIADRSRQQAAPMPADQVRQFAGVRPLADAEVAEIVAALAMIPAVERETWLHVGMAQDKDGGGAPGYELRCTWSQRCAEKFDPQDQLRVWRSFTRKPIGQAVQLGTVFDLACKHGFCRPKPALVLVAPAPVGEVDPRTMKTTPELVAGPRVQLQAMPVQGLNDLARWIFDSSPNAHGLLAQAAALAAYKRLSTDDRAKLLGRLDEDDDITDMFTPRGKRIVARQFVVERAVVVTMAAP